jgi:hypothetical protein
VQFIAAEYYQARLAVLQHGHEFARRLAIVKRNDDDAFGQQREVNGNPVD